MHNAKSDASAHRIAGGAESWPVAALIVLAAGLALLTWGMMAMVGVQGLGLWGVAAIAAGWLVVLLCGVLLQISCASRLPRPDLCFAVSAGVVVASIAVLVLCELLRVSAARAFVILSCAVLCIAFLQRKQFEFSPTGAGAAGVVAALCCALCAALWCWVPLGSAGNLPQTGTLSLWTDCFIHATTILGYGDFHSLGRGNFEFIDSPRFLYHYGSFVLPAAVLPLADMSGLQAAVALHIPLGLVAMFCGVFSLAGQVATSAAGRVAAALSVALLFLLPDPSTYALANGWFDVRWMLLASPGSAYAIAGVLVSLSLAKAWLDTRRPVSLVAAFVVAFMVFQLRVHMLMWYGPALVLLLIAGEPRFRKLLPYALGVGVLGVLAMLPFATVMPYLTFVHAGIMEPTGYTGLYANLMAALGEGWAAPIGFLLLFPAMLGGLLVLYPVFVLAWRRVGKLEPFGLFPFMLAASGAVAILFAPASWLDPFEFKHRAFVLLYIVALIWTVGLGTSFCFKAFGRRAAFSAAGAVAAVFLLLAAWRPAAFLDAGRPNFDWGKKYVDQPVPLDLMAAAEFVRQKASGPEVAVVLPLDDQAGAADNTTFFSAIANTPTYLSRHAIRPAAIANSRLDFLEKLRNSPDYPEVRAQMASNGLHWFVLNSASAPAFDPDFSRPAFRQGAWVVYDFR